MRSRRGCKGWPWALAAFAADQLTKAIVRQTRGRHELIPGLLRCRPVRNTGMAFSMLSGHFYLLTLATAAILVGLTVWLIKNPDEPPLMRTGLWMIVGGGLGNLADRLLYGSVTDFLEIEFANFAIFNVADVFVCLGAALAALGILTAGRAKGEDGHGAV